MTHLSVSEERRNGVSQRGKYREELLRSQQGELDAVLIYQRLAKVVKTDKERETFLQLAKKEGRHASVFHAYTQKALKPKKRKIKYSAIFCLCWFAVLVILVDGILKFQTLVDYFGSYALVEILLLLLVIIPTIAVYKLTKE